MNVTLEDISSVKKVLHIEFPADKIDEALNEAYKDIKKDAQVKGYRKGKVPHSVLQQMYGKQINDDVSKALIQQYLPEAIKEKQLKTIGFPIIKEKPQLKQGEACKIDLDIEVMPEIDDIDFKELKLKKNIYQISEQEIEAQLKAFQKQMSKLEPIQEQRPAQEEDWVLIDYEGFQYEEPFPQTPKTENASLKIGECLITKEFDDSLIGMNPDEEKNITVTFPGDYKNKEIANMQLDFTIKLKEIRQENIPELNDELAKKTGKYNTLEELREEIKRSMSIGYAKRAEQEVYEQVFQELIAKSDFEIPDFLIEEQLNGFVQEAQRSFEANGKDMEELGLTVEHIKKNYRSTAEEQVRRFLLLQKIIQQGNLEFSDEEFEAGLKRIAEENNQPFENIKANIENDKKSADSLRNAFFEKKAMNHIIDQAQVTEVEPAEQELPTDDKPDVSPIKEEPSTDGETEDE